MSIRFAVLGLLSEGPLHGYAIRARFEQRLGELWELNYGQVYGILAALEADGLVSATEESVGRRLRRIYAISTKGNQTLQGWMRGLDSRGRPFRDDSFLRLLLTKPDDLSDCKQFFDNERRRTWRELRDLVDRRDAEESSEDWRSVVTRLYLDAAILHHEARIKALDRCREVLSGKLAPAAEAVVQPPVLARAAQGRGVAR